MLTAANVPWTSAHVQVSRREGSLHQNSSTCAQTLEQVTCERSDVIVLINHSCHVGVQTGCFHPIIVGGERSTWVLAGWGNKQQHLWHVRISKKILDVNQMFLSFLNFQKWKIEDWTQFRCFTIVGPSWVALNADIIAKDREGRVCGRWFGLEKRDKRSALRTTNTTAASHSSM